MLTNGVTAAMPSLIDSLNLQQFSEADQVCQSNGIVEHGMERLDELNDDYSFLKMIVQNEKPLSVREMQSAQKTLERFTLNTLLVKQTVSSMVKAVNDLVRIQ